MSIVFTLIIRIKNLPNMDFHYMIVLWADAGIVEIHQ